MSNDVEREFSTRYGAGGVSGAGDPTPLGEIRTLAQLHAYLRKLVARSGLSLRAIEKEAGRLTPPRYTGYTRMAASTVSDVLNKRLPTDAQLRTLFQVCRAEKEASVLLKVRASLEVGDERREEARGPGQRDDDAEPEFGPEDLVRCEVWPVRKFLSLTARMMAPVRSRRRTLQNLLADATAPTPYVPRVFDAELRAKIRAGREADQARMVLLVGRSATGKTRSLLEAIRHECPEWWVVRPDGAAGAEALCTGAPIGFPCVLWLDELQYFFDSDGSGPTRSRFRELGTLCRAGLVVVGGVWPSKLLALTDRSVDGARNSRELLEDRALVTTITVPDSLTTDAELASAREFGQRDGRLADAMENRDEFGFVQALAGAGELVDRYEKAPRPARRVLDAAATLRELGVEGPLPASLLEDFTFAMWRAEHGRRRPQSNWFEDALDYATSPVRADTDAEDVSCMYPVDVPADGGSAAPDDHYELADFLVQLLADRGRGRERVPDSAWTVLIGAPLDDRDLWALSRSALARGRRAIADEFAPKMTTARQSARFYDFHSELERAEEELRRAAADGEPGAYTELAMVRKRLAASRSHARAVDAGAAFRGAIDAGEPGAYSNLARHITWRRPDADRAWQAAIAANEPRARTHYAQFLGRSVEAEAAWRAAVVAGESDSALNLAKWLDLQPGRQRAAEAAWRLVADVLPAAFSTRAAWLQFLGRTHQAMQVWYDAAHAGEPSAWTSLAVLLIGRPDCADEAEEAWRQALRAGEPLLWTRRAEALTQLTTWSPRFAGDTPRGSREQQMIRDALRKGVVTAWREAARRGEPAAASRLATYLMENGGPPGEIEETWRRAVLASERDARVALAQYLDGLLDRLPDAERAWRDAVDADIDGARTGLAGNLSQQRGRARDTERAWLAAIAAGDRAARQNLATWLEGQPGRQADAAAAWRAAAMAGELDAYSQLARVLSWLYGRRAEAAEARRVAFVVADRQGWKVAPWVAGTGRHTDDDERAWKTAAELREVDASSFLARFYERQGRWTDTEHAWSRAVETNERGARSCLAQMLAARGRVEEAEAAWRSAVVAGEKGAFDNLVALLRGLGCTRSATADRVQQNGLDEFGNTA